MKKVLLIVCSTLVFSCKKEEKAPLPLPQNEHVQTITLDEKNSIETDTVFFTYNAKSKLEDYALIHLLSKKYGKDSLCTALFQLEFMKDKKMYWTHSLEIKGYDQGSEWYGDLELDSIASPLKKLSIGYPACGYTQNNYLFYLKGDTKNFVHSWESMSDGGWGTWSEVLSGTPENFIVRTESFSPKDDNEDIGLAEYSDSIQFTLLQNRWQKSYKTPKGKVYRTATRPFQ